MPDTVYLIDTYSLVFQVFHAIRQPMTGSRGQPTNAVFGFTRDLQYLLKEKKPTHMVVAMESMGPGVRNQMYADYKAHRTEMPEDLRPQIPMILDVIEAYGIPIVRHDGWEADDVIATLARQAAGRGMEVRIVTSDKDARQLIGPRVKLYNVRKNQVMDESFLLKDWGIRPDQVIDFQALVGDSVDNIPGVPLVGPKKASALLQQFGDLEGVLANAEKAPGAKIRENLRTYAEQARVSQKLARLNTDLPLEFDWEAARVREPDRERLLELFTDYAFGRFTDEIRSELSSTESQRRTAERRCDVVDTEEGLAEFLKELRKQRAFCVDLETTGVAPMQTDIVGWAFSWQAGAGWYIPVAGPPGQPRLDCGRVLQALKPILEDPNVEITNQNVKHEMLVLRRAGVRVQNVGVDPMVGDYLLDAGARSHGLDSLAARYLNHRMIAIKDVVGTGKTQKKMFEVDIEEVARHSAEDADIAWQLAQKVTERLKAEGLWDLYWALERPLIHVLAELEFNGVRVDREELARQSADVSGRLEGLMAEIHDLAGREFNIGSPKQLAEVLFEELKLRPVKRTKTGPSTDQDVLEILAGEHPLPAKIIEHRQLAKLKGTYLDALPQMINPETGKIHCSFNQVVAATGRLSSSDPNLQNIPIRTDEGRRVRKAFVPSEPGWKLLCADYSQVELRMLAHFSKDPALVAAFQQGQDIHTAVAAQVFGVDPRDVQPEMRRVAKAVNFGVIYGQSPFGLAAVLGIPQSEAAQFIDGYFATYGEVDRYFHELLAECKRTGYATTILGRRRRISGIISTTGHRRNAAERTAINTVIQGSAADLIKTAMIRIHSRLDDLGRPARMLLQIHDELVFEAPEAEARSLAQLVRTEMQNALELTVPVVVDLRLGDNWLEAAPLADLAG